MSMANLQNVKKLTLFFKEILRFALYDKVRGIIVS